MKVVKGPFNQSLYIVKPNVNKPYVPYHISNKVQERINKLYIKTYEKNVTLKKFDCDYKMDILNCVVSKVKLDKIMKDKIIEEDNIVEMLLVTITSSRRDVDLGSQIISKLSLGTWSKTGYQGTPGVVYVLRVKKDKVKEIIEITKNIENEILGSSEHIEKFQEISKKGEVMEEFLLNKEIHKIIEKNKKDEIFGFFEE